MDKKTLSNYGWIVVLVLVLAVLVSIATPFGQYIARAIKSTSEGFQEVNKNSLNAADIVTGNVEFEGGGYLGGGGVNTGNEYVSDYTGPVPEMGKTAEEYTWEEIAQISESGRANQYFRIGDTKTFNYRGKIVTMRIAAFNADKESDSSAMAGITWLSDEVLTTSTMTNMSSTFTTIINGMPSALKEAIVLVDKTVWDEDIHASHDVSYQIWLPSSREMMVFDSVEDRGPIYSTVYPTRASKIKYNFSGTATSYWTRTSDSLGNYVIIDKNGESSDDISSRSTMGVAIGFCTGIQNEKKFQGADENLLPAKGTALEDCTWEQISAISKTGKADEYFNIGDCKTITLTTGVTFEMQIVAFNEEKNSNNVYSGITWLSKQVLESRKMTNTLQEYGWSWGDSDLRKYMRDELYYTLPEEVRNSIMVVYKGSVDYSDQTVYLDENIWIPSTGELKSWSVTKDSGSYVQPKYTVSGGGGYWWTRSTYSTYEGWFSMVHNTGYIDKRQGTVSLGIVLAFCT